MPIMGGLEAAATLHARLGAACPPICALTASTSDAEKQRCLDAGMDAHLSKPIKPPQLGLLNELVVAGRTKRAAPPAVPSSSPR